MNQRTKNSLIKAMQRELTKLARTRDNLRELKEELKMQVENSYEASELLEACIDKLSELN